MLRLLGKRVLRESRRTILFKMGNETPSRICGYYVMFPVIPDETVENNSFLANIASNGDWPTLATSSPKEMYEGTVRSLMEYGATVMEHTEHLEEATENKSFEGVVGPLLSEEYEVNYAFQTLLLKMMTDWPECSSKAFDADLHHIKVTCAREHMEKLTSPTFQHLLKSLYENPSEDMDEWKLRLVEWYLLEIKASGLDKHDQKTRKLIGSWSHFVDEYRSKYLTNIMSTNDQYQFTVTDRNVIKDAPPHILKLLAVDKKSSEHGPWKARMAPGSILPFLQYCGDRSLRATAWDKWTSRASFEHDFYNNSINIEELRHNNDGWAKTLGFSSVSEHRLSNKMAGTPDTVRNFINALNKRMGPVFHDRRESWIKFASVKELITDLQPSDLFYICRREAHDHYDVNSLDLMNHFPFWPTFNNLIEIVSHIFNLKFQDISDSGLERCHPSARIYSVADLATGEHLGRLYIDPFDRESKRGSWNTLLGRNQSEQRGLDKIVYMNGLANQPNSAGESLLHHSQLSQLLSHFGRSVQLLLSRSPYRDITIPWAPMYASDWDAADLFPAFLQFFIYKPNLLQALSSPHVVTGSAMDENEANRASLALSRATLWESYRALFWADYDLSIFEMEDRKKKFWLDMYREKYKEYFPFKLGRNDYHPCSFTPIFAMQPHMGMYYRKLWTEMLALDVHETFDHEGDEPSTGERLKQTILNRGAGDMQSELYRRFQGRDPSVGAICDFYDPPALYNVGEGEGFGYDPIRIRD
ncbi:hypothetical protein QR680_018359 [Steinernema hermaphroditum]|uniref:Peptidase M3A/M3B catalytic domain-containing protein n=1 Tax=Steinernema hermaphroditum TaxID=289476 RepID=A0AA39LQM1_9BILA|nr:hypothetical protein QR680_018359 [Steinernema hermaphroditum]